MIKTLEQKGIENLVVGIKEQERLDAEFEQFGSYLTHLSSGVIPYQTISQDDDIFFRREPYFLLMGSFVDEQNFEKGFIAKEMGFIGEGVYIHNEKPNLYVNKEKDNIKELLKEGKYNLFTTVIDHIYYDAMKDRNSRMQLHG